jgi:TPR repeat protein
MLLALPAVGTAMTPTQLTQAAEAGDVDAMEKLALIHHHGTLVPQDQETARHWFKRCAEAGKDTCQHSYGVYLQFGYGGAPDKPAAVDWYLKAAQNDYVPPLMYLGDMHFHGDGIPMDRAMASVFYQRAAVLGDPRGQYVFGQFLYFGEQFPKDTAKAYAWISLSAAQGYEKSVAFLDRMRAEMSADALERARAFADTCAEYGNSGCL